MHSKVNANNDGVRRKEVPAFWLYPQSKVPPAILFFLFFLKQQNQPYRRLRTGHYWIILSNVIFYFLKIKLFENIFFSFLGGFSVTIIVLN